MYINNTFLFGSCILLIAYPIWLYFFLKWNYYSLQYKEVSDKYKNAYGEIELYDNHSAIWTPILFCLRRFALAFVCVCFDGHPFWQFAFLFVWQMVNLIYLGEVRPYKTRS